MCVCVCVCVRACVRACARARVCVCEWAENRQTRFYGCQLGAARRSESISSPRPCLFVWIFAAAPRIKRSEKGEGYLAHIEFTERPSWKRPGHKSPVSKSDSSLPSNLSHID